MQVLSANPKYTLHCKYLWGIINIVGKFFNVSVENEVAIQRTVHGSLTAQLWLLSFGCSASAAQLRPLSFGRSTLAAQLWPLGLRHSALAAQVNDFLVFFDAIV